MEVPPPRPLPEEREIFAEVFKVKRRGRSERFRMAGLRRSGILESGMGISNLCSIILYVLR
jgi:hypothetical protein